MADPWTNRCLVSTDTTNEPARSGQQNSGTAQLFQTNPPAGLSAGALDLAPECRLQAAERGDSLSLPPEGGVPLPHMPESVPAQSWRRGCTCRPWISPRQPPVGTPRASMNSLN